MLPRETRRTFIVAESTNILVTAFGPTVRGHPIKPDPGSEHESCKARERKEEDREEKEKDSGS